MAAALLTCTVDEQRCVIRFLWAEGVKPSEIYRRMKVQYGDSCLCQRKVYEWVERFKNGRDNVSDEKRSGRPVIVATETVKQQIEQRIRDNRRVTIDEIAVEFHMSHGAAYKIVHDDSGYRKVCSRWIPRQLSDEQKHTRQTICQQHLDRHAREVDAFLNRIVTGDESWVHHYEPKSKRQSMQWKHPTSPPPIKFKTQASAGKVMLTIFWDVNGPILMNFLERGETVTSARYSDMLATKLKLTIRSKRRGLLSKGVLLLHDNVRLHMAAHTVDTLQTLRFEVLKHPAYSPDLAPSDFHLFGPLKEHLRGQRFADDNEVMSVVQTWLLASPKSFYLAGIHNLVDRWTTCVARQGDYVEK